MALSTGSLPIVTANAQALSGAAASLLAAADRLAAATSTTLSAWKGINSDNYSAPESPAVEQSIPKIDDPMATIEANLRSLSAACEAAAAQVPDLKWKRADLCNKIWGYNHLVADTASKKPRTAEINLAISSKRESIRVDTANYLQAIAAVDQTLASAISALRAPKPKLPLGQINAGVAAGNRATFEGPNADAAAGYVEFVDGGTTYKGYAAYATATLVDAQAHGQWNVGPGELSANASFNIKADASAMAATSITSTGVHARVGAQASAGANAHADVEYRAGVIGAGASADGFVGAKASVDGDIGVGLDGISVKAGGKAFAGAEGGAETHLDVAGVEAKAGIKGQAGIGVEFNAEGKITWQEVKVKLDVSACLGLGGGGSIDLSIKPKEIVENVTKAGKAVLDKLPDIDLPDMPDLHLPHVDLNPFG